MEPKAKSEKRKTAVQTAQTRVCCFLFLAFHFSFLILLAGCAPTVIPLPRAHAHNDYRHTRPLHDALDNGFCSVETDVHLVDGKLLVGHAVEDTDPKRTLQSLYLDPLRDHVKRNGGCVFPAKRDQSLTLMVDLKTEGGPTYEVLRDALLPYNDILTMTFLDGTVNPRPVTVILTGRVPRAWVAREPVRFVACDGILEDLATRPAPALDLVPQVNAKWDALFTWHGVGAMPKEQQFELRKLAARAHEQRRKIRFWAAPDNPAAWETMFGCGVDLINSDDLPGLRRFLLSRRAAHQ
jgi:hypothetical protein